MRQRTDSVVHCAYARHVSYVEFNAVSLLVGANQKREMIMRHLKLIAAALVVLALSACVAGIIVPVPVSNSTGTQDTDRNEYRDRNESR